MLKIKIPKYLGKKWLSTKPCRNLKEILNSVCDNWQQFQNCQPNITESKTFSSYISTQQKCHVVVSKTSTTTTPNGGTSVKSLIQEVTNQQQQRGNGNNHCSCCRLFRVSERHSLYIRPLFLMELSSETLGNLPCFLE